MQQGHPSGGGPGGVGDFIGAGGPGGLDTDVYRQLMQEMHGDGSRQQLQPQRQYQHDPYNQSNLYGYQQQQQQLGYGNPGPQAQTADYSRYNYIAQQQRQRQQQQQQQQQQQPIQQSIDPAMLEQMLASSGTPYQSTYQQQQQMHGQEAQDFLSHDYRQQQQQLLQEQLLLRQQQQLQEQYQQAQHHRHHREPPQQQEQPHQHHSQELHYQRQQQELHAGQLDSFLHHQQNFGSQKHLDPYAATRNASYGNAGADGSNMASASAYMAYEQQHQQQQRRQQQAAHHLQQFQQVQDSHSGLGGESMHLSSLGGMTDVGAFLAGGAAPPPRQDVSSFLMADQGGGQIGIRLGDGGMGRGGNYASNLPTVGDDAGVDSISGVAGENVRYCSCQRTEDECDGGMMIECAHGKGGCNGWFHPECEGLSLTEEDVASGSFLCSLCSSARGGNAGQYGGAPGRCRSKATTAGRRKGKGGGSQGRDGFGGEEGEDEKAVRVTSRGRVVKKVKNLDADDDSIFENEEDDYSDEGPRKGGGGYAGAVIGPPLPHGMASTSAVEKILAWRMYTPHGTGDGRGGEPLVEEHGEEKSQPNGKEDYWLVKWKDKSYLHVSWETRAGLLRQDSSADQKLKRFEKQMVKLRGPAWREMLLEDRRENPKESPDWIEPEVTEVHRVIACETGYVNLQVVVRQVRRKRHALLVDEQAGEAGRDGAMGQALPVPLPPLTPAEEMENHQHDRVRYLVKWRGLPYAEASWEKWADIKDFAYEEVGLFWVQQRPDLKLNPALAMSMRALHDVENPTFGHRSYTFLSIYDPDGPTDIELPSAPLAPPPTIAPPPSLAEGGTEEQHRQYQQEMQAQAAAHAASSLSVLQLRDYQLTGLKWLIFNYYQRRPSILADEMGLGKTIQTMAFLTQLYRTQEGKNRGPFIIVAPLSLINQWQGEAGTWAPDLNVLVYHGNTDSRQVLRDYEFHFDEPYIRAEEAHYLKQRNILKFDILLTTYETVIKDIKILSRIMWKVLVVDEAHRLKNPASRLFVELRTLPRDHCVLLTGTPLQNKTEELWALLNFADPVHFGDQAGFSREYGDLKDASQVENLHNMLKPFLLRRIKEDVEKSLPPKEETIVEVSLTPLQRKFYMAIYDRNTAFLFKESKASMAPSLMNVMMELRKCCNHAYLNRGVEERILSEIPLPQRTPENLHHQLVSCSGKMVLLDKLLPRLKKEGHKVLIFSQMVRVLDLVEDYMRYVGHSYERLDGTKKATERSAAVVRFNNPALNRFVMLLSTRAGGLGLNLTAADTVIIYDSDWNPHNDLQAQARAHRIGQTKAVKVYRLLTRKSYEIEMFHAASLKLGLDRAVLAHQRAEGEMEANSGAAGRNDGVGPSDSASSLLKPSKAQLGFSHMEVEHLLKRGAYDVFRGDDAEGQEFQEADIDQILKRQSHKVVYGNQDSLTKNLASSFSKASFVSVDNKKDIDLDDPDFWKKAIGLAEPAQDAIKATSGLATSDILGEGEKRKRKRNERFDPKTLAGLEESLEGYDSAFEGQSFEDDSGGEAASQSGSSEAQPRRRGRPRKGEIVRVRGRTRRRGKSEGNEATVGNGRFSVGPDGRVISGTGVDGSNASTSPTTQLRRAPKWGPHSRDRLIRALLEFGFGRWKRIRSESLASDVPLGEVESFCRSYVLQCGLCAGEGKRARQESKFVKDAIAAATKLAAQMKSGEIVIPEVLQDERFLSRLRQGMARKALVRLDLLLRLQTPIMNDAVRLAYMALSPEALTAKGLPDNLSEHPEQLMSRMPNFEDRFQNLGREEVAAHILLGEVRPSWTQVTPWWDLECDKHLLLGVYMHGFQNYNAIRDDPNLCFRRKMEAWLVDNPKGFMLETKPPPLASNAKEQSLSRDFTWSPLQIFLRLPRRLAQAKENESSEAGNGGDAGTKEEGETSEEAACREYFRAVTLPGKRVSGYRGVYAQPGSVHWVVQIQQLTGTQCVGYFASEKKAALAYDAAARRLYGPDADTNFTSEADASSVAASTASTTQLQHRASSSDPAASPLSPAAAVQGGEASSDSPPMIASSASMISVDSVDKEEEVLRRRPEVTKLPDHELPLSWHRSSRYRGVRAAGPKWTAQISYNGQNHHLGTFNSELEAALAYDALSRRYHVGQMAVLNFPDGPEEELNRIDALMEELTAKKLPGGWPQGGAEEAAAVAATTIALEQAKLEKVTGRSEKENRATEEEENAAIEEVVVSNEQKEGGQISRMEEEGVKSMKEEMPVEGTAEGATCDGDRVGKKEVKLEDVQSQGAEKEEESNDVRMKSSAEEETGAAAVKGALSDMKAEKPEGSAAGTAPVVPERAAENVSKEGLSVEKMEASECEKAFARPDGTNASASREADYGEEKPEKGIGERSKPAVIGRATPEVDGPEDEAKEKKDEEKVGENDLQETDKAREEASQDGSLAVGESMKKKVETAELDGTAVKATGDQVLESMIKKFWPDGYKILSKLVTWLIDDPEARLSHSDLKLQTSGEGFRVDASGRPIKRRPSEEDERGFGGANTGDPIHKKIKPSPGSLRGSGAWSTEECRRLCNALLMSGAPLSSPPLPVTLFLATAGKLSESVLVGRTSPSAAHSVDQVIGHLPTFTWEDVRVRANLPNKPPEELQAFYVTQLLPLFQKLCTHREPLPEAGEGLSTIPDPTKGVLEHTAGSRSIAYTFMRRQQLIRAVRYILEKKPRRLVEYLGSAEGKAAGRSLPGWWQGTRHDVALMLGSWWKGLLCIDHIRRETKLGLCDAAIFAHLKKAVNEKATATDRPQPSEAELQDYSERALAAFPDRKTLEERLHRICIVIARNVPAGADLRTMGARAKSPSSDFSGGLTTVLPVPGHEKEGSEGKENGGVLNEGVETKIVRESPGGTTTPTSPTSVVTATPSPKGHEAMGAVGTSISSAPGEL